MSILNKKILIIGSTGLIGTHLSKKLLSKGANVTGISRSGRKPISKLSFIEGDILNSEFLEEIIKKKFDIIFNCAGLSGEINCHENSRLSYQTNFLAVKKIVDLIIEYSPSTKFIQLGSRLEYGKSLYNPVDESHPTNPIGQYGQHKLKATNYIIKMCQKKNLQAVVLRISNVSGPQFDRKHKNYNIMSNFINKAKNKETLTIFGDGKQLRDYININKLVDVIIPLSLSHKSNGEIYNVGSGKGISFENMTKKIANKYDVKIGRGQN